MTPRLAIAVIVAALLVLGLEAPASAQTPAPAQTSETDVALAESLFQQAQALMKQKRYAEACPKFQESQRLDPGGGTLFQLATCHALTRKVASAWAEFLEVALLAKQRNRPDIEQAAREKAAELEPQLSTLVIVVPDQARLPRLTVHRDGTTIGAAAFGTAMPVDPGAHTIRVEAPGYLPWSTTIEIADNADRQSVTVPRLETAPASPAKTALGGPAPAPAPEAPPRRSPALLYTGLGVSLVGIGTAAFFGVRSYTKEREARERCPDADDPCDDSSAVAASKAAVTSANIANIAGAAGLVGLGFTAYYLLTDSAPEKSKRQAFIRAVPELTRERVSIGIDARF